MAEVHGWADHVQGRLLAGKYRLGALIGHGGMGAVFEAHDTVLKRDVAVKLIHPERRAEGTRIERFRREALAAAKIGGEGVVQVHDFDFDADLGPFSVLERLRGESVNERLTRGPMPLPEAVALVLEVLATLELAHGAGIVHRDIKPANVYLHLDSRGATNVKLLDFGIARIQTPAELTVPGTRLGTPGFMSPEQLSGHDVDARSDLYAVGVLLDTCVCGVTPLHGLEPAVVAARTLNRDVPSLRSRRPHLPKVVLDAVHAATRFEADERPATASALAQLLAGAPVSPIAPPSARQGFATRGAASETLMSGAVNAIAIPDTADPEPSAASAGSSRRRSAVIGGGTIAVLALFGAAAGIGTVLLADATGTASEAADRDAAPAAADRSEAELHPPSDDETALPSAPSPALASLAARADDADDHVRAARLEQAIEAYASVGRDAWNQPASAARDALIVHVFTAKGDAHLEALRRRDIPCGASAMDDLNGATESYQELMRLGDPDTLQLAQRYYGRMYESLVTICGRGDPTGERLYWESAQRAYHGGDRPGPHRAEILAGLARCQSALAP